MKGGAAPVIGPILTLDDVSGTACHLAALFVTTRDDAVPMLRCAGRSYAAERLSDVADRSIHRIRFVAPADKASQYDWNGQTFDLATDLRGDLRLAFVSCNGEEHGDLERNEAERNAMWARLVERHRADPFSLLLHGGDQIYADEATRGHPLSEGWPQRMPDNPSPSALMSLRDHLRVRFLARYLAVYAAPEVAWLIARVPSLMQWDDHDICDGWGSLPASRTDSPVGRTLFSVARGSALLFQHAACDGGLPARFADPRGDHLGWRIDAPGLRLIAPDLRSERTRDAVMGPAGWGFMQAMGAMPPTAQILMLSSVPLLGPRLSILEALMVLIPRMQKYEDDLRDQWQSRAHRAEWRRMLALLRDIAVGTGASVAALSGEIHLATRAEMALGPDRALHQLVASGVAHRPPPRAWARAMDAIALLGEGPLAGHPITIRRLPGQAGRYVAERNALILERHAGQWSARWDLEVSGLTDSVDL